MSRLMQAAQTPLLIQTFREMIERHNHLLFPQLTDAPQEEELEAVVAADVDLLSD